MANLCLKFNLGKLTERNNRTQTKLISDPKELYRFLAVSRILVINMFANDDVVWVSWTLTAEERVSILRHTNEVIGAYVTAGARIHIYRYLDKLQENAIYCDIDSIIFIQSRDESEHVGTGDSLGDVTSELKPGHYISEFVSEFQRIMRTR